MAWTAPTNRRRQLLQLSLVGILFILVFWTAHPSGASSFMPGTYPPSRASDLERERTESQPPPPLPEYEPSPTTEHVEHEHGEHSQQTQAQQQSQQVEAAASVEPSPEPTPAGPPPKSPPPPEFQSVRAWVHNLPQHDLDLPFPEGKTGRYVRFANEARYVGWNNCLNERLMNAHLAYRSGRAYVFGEHYWARHHYPWPASQQPYGGPRTPLPAILSGPMAGGSWDAASSPASAPVPRAISSDWFDVVCPVEERRIINTTDVKPHVPNGGSNDAEGTEILGYWRKVLEEAPERCVEVVPAPHEVDVVPQVFDMWLWGSPRVLSLWDEFRDSPISRMLAPSPIVRAAIARNAYLFEPKTRVASATSAFDRMLAVHVRRGDYIGHCSHLWRWNATYYSWAQLPQLLDRYIPGQTEDEMLVHCLPNAEQLAERIAEVRREYLTGASGRTLDVLYLLTNADEGDEAWLAEVLRRLKAAGVWSTIVSTPEMVLDAEQIEVSMAVDMQIAREAAVFLGNGVSIFINVRCVSSRVLFASFAHSAFVFSDACIS
ncbi:hypothetical protein HMN09_00698300 [Mycena chlorophos]|uniref:Uncharacterized protein n=1 Tax=Mycena chlorophos TaxID=658473 RepID=A0A8H6WBB9_MYCCL|nr:hypothetical protein HMN09_00698300 [Mycena chlorophos]